MTHVHDLRVEHHVTALGIGEASPRLSWVLISTEWNLRQEAYQVRVQFDDGSSQVSPRIDGSVSSSSGMRPVTA